MVTSLQIVLALIFDRLIGDPRWSAHPVVLIGNGIAWLEKGLRRPQDGATRKKWAGAVLVAVVLTVVYGITALILQGLALLHPWAAWGIGALLLSFAISPRSLAEAGQEIRDLMQQDNLEQARFKVGWIVGRDTASLSTGEISRATVETVAENIVDGIISPLFYAVIGGVPLAFLYRAVNTMDSMVGYKNEKYQDFGMVAARVDDVFNYIPARITGVLLLASAWLLRRDAGGAIRMICRDAAKHPSPNSGISEAGVAGALGIRLGGLNYYGGAASQRAYMGDETIPLAPVHIDQTISLMYTATWLFALAAVLWDVWRFRYLLGG
ncbi:MAG TPA: adenosylcobinamide-phosphate synthase CbiB [Patescibacteria group bacterium]|nr:adenosylcobinamide-phosphate synthase CbiB [Patescibacteria group bacterium]